MDVFRAEAQRSGMLPACLSHALSQRAEFVTSQVLPSRDGAEQLIYYVLSGCVVVLNRNGAAAAVSWAGDLVLAPSEAEGCDLRIKAVSETVCLRGRRSDLFSACGTSGELVQWLWQQQARREAELHRRLELLTAESVERRVLNTVADLALRSRSAAPGLPMPLAQNEIAELAGATRETTSTLLNRMRRRGVVELGRRRIQVPVPEVLRALQGLTDEQPHQRPAGA